MGVGTQTAAIAAGGETGDGPTASVKNESWDGTSWTEVNNLLQAKQTGSGMGTQTAALVAGGITPPGNTRTTNTQGWDGTSWSTKPAISTARNEVVGSGTSSLGLIAGGSTGSPSNTTEEYSELGTVKVITDS